MNKKIIIGIISAGILATAFFAFLILKEKGMVMTNLKDGAEEQKSLKALTKEEMEKALSQRGNLPEGQSGLGSEDGKSISDKLKDALNK